MQHPIFSQVHWSEPELVKLRSGEQKFVQTAEVPDGFNQVWSQHKDQIKAMGVSLAKNDRDGTWTLKLWTPLGQQPAPASAAPPSPASIPAPPQAQPAPQGQHWAAPVPQSTGWQAPPQATPQPAIPPAMPPEMAGFEAAAAQVTNWPGHDVTSVSDQINDAIPDFAGPASDVAHHAGGQQLTDPTSVKVGDWLRNAPDGMKLETIVRVACESVGGGLSNRQVLVTLAKVAEDYKEKT